MSLGIINIRWIDISHMVIHHIEYGGLVRDYMFDVRFI